MGCEDAPRLLLVGASDGSQPEKDAKEEKDSVGRIVWDDSDELGRNFSASSPNAERNSALATSRAVNLSCRLIIESHTNRRKDGEKKNED